MSVLSLLHCCYCCWVLSMGLFSSLLWLFLFTSAAFQAWQIVKEEIFSHSFFPSVLFLSFFPSFFPFFSFEETKFALLPSMRETGKRWAEGRVRVFPAEPKEGIVETRPNGTNCCRERKGKWRERSEGNQREGGGKRWEEKWRLEDVMVSCKLDPSSINHLRQSNAIRLNKGGMSFSPILPLGNAKLKRKKYKKTAQGQ